MAGEAATAAEVLAPVTSPTGGAFKLDALLDKFEQGAPEAEDAEVDEPAGELDEELDEELPGDEDEDSDELDEDDGEDDDPDDDPDDDEAKAKAKAEPEEREDVLTGLSEKELDRITKDPALKKLHRLMQRDFTEKTTAVAERERTVAARGQAFDDLEAELSTAQGFVGFLADHMTRRPDIVGTAFEQVATGEGGHAFLVAIGRQNPEALEKAWERVQELVDDEDERKRYDRDVEQTVREQRLKGREDRALRETFARELGSLEEAALKEARTLGIPKEDHDMVTARLRKALDGKVNADGTLKLNKQGAKAVAREVKAEIDRLEARVASRLKQQVSTKSRETVKKKATAAASPNRVPPRNVVSGGPKKAPENVAFVPPKGRDPLDAFLHARVAGKA